MLPFLVTLCLAPSAQHHLTGGSGRSPLPAILDKLRAEALSLSDSERAALAYDLVKSLDTPADSDAANEWDNEIVRRLRAIDSGTAKLIDRDELTRRFKERLNPR